MSKRKLQHNALPINKKSPKTIDHNNENLDLKNNQYECLYKTFSLKRAMNVVETEVAKFNNDFDFDYKYNNGETLLMVAFKFRYFEKAKYLINHGAKVIGVDNDGNTPLHYYINYFNTKFDKIDSFYAFLELGKDSLAIKNKHNHMPIDLAKNNGFLKPHHIKTIEKMMQGDDLSIEASESLSGTLKTDGFYQDVMLEYMKKYKIDLKRIQLFLSNHQKQIDINHKYLGGETLLMHGFANHALAKCKYLIDQKADINQIDENGNTALIYLLRSIKSPCKKSINTIYELINLAESTINISNNNGKTALDIAKENSNINHDILNYIAVKSGQILPPIYITEDEKEKIRSEVLNIFTTKKNIDSESFIKLCQPLDDFNYRLSDGKTLLMAAFISQLFLSTKYLISRGADLGLADFEGNTALHYFYEHYHNKTDNQNTLVKFSALGQSLASIQNNKGVTPLDVAKKNPCINFNKLSIFLNNLSASKKKESNVLTDDDSLLNRLYENEDLNDYILEDVNIHDNLPPPPIVGEIPYDITIF